MQVDTDLIPQKQCNASGAVRRPDGEQKQLGEEVESLGRYGPPFSYQQQQQHEEALDRHQQPITNNIYHHQCSAHHY